MRWVVLQRWWLVVALSTLVACGPPAGPAPTAAPPTAAAKPTAPATSAPTAAPGAAAAKPVAPTSVPASATAPAKPASAAFQKDWDDLVAKAKAEGELVAVLGPDTVEAERQIYMTFGQKFGIKPTLVGGPADEVVNRVLAERSQGLYTVDIAGLGGNGTRRAVAAKLFAELTPQLFHPEILDRSGWRVDWFPWSSDDPDRKYVTLYGLSAEANLIRLYYNTKTVTKDDLASLKSWNDFLQPRWKGKIVLGNVAEGEQAGDARIAWLHLGEPYLDRLLGDMHPSIVAYGAVRDYADGLARGQWDIGIFPGGSEQAIVEAKSVGLPVDVFPHTLAEGSDASATRNLGIVDHAAHPNAAKLFVNWYLSREGATVYNEMNSRPGIASLRKDVPQGKVPDDVWARASDPHLTIDDEGTPQFRDALVKSQDYFKRKFQELGLSPGG
jgi:iron(III) transport system substrate-binding protein